MELIFGALLALFFLRDEPPPAAPQGAVLEELVVVLPTHEGPLGAVVVERADRRQVLDEPFEASRIRGSGTPTGERLDQAQVQREFGDLLGSLPSLTDELTVVVPSSEDGHVGTVVVERAGGRQVLSDAYAASRIRSLAPPQPERMSAERMQQEFGEVRGALPSLSDELAIMLPPDEGGPTGTVVVERAGGRQVLGDAFAASRIRSLGPPQPERLSAAEVRREFGDVLAALPSLTEELVVVIPADFDGHVGTVVVERAGGQVVLNEAYAASYIGDLGPPRARKATQAEIASMFEATLAGVPQPPTRYRLYFVLGSDDLMAESKVALKAIVNKIVSRRVPDVLVVGHTDSVGPVDVNDRLSMQRAERVKRLLVRAGISAERVTVAGRGSREPLVPTPEGVEEPRNRRVEIDVR